MSIQHPTPNIHSRDKGAVTLVFTYQEQKLVMKPVLNGIKEFKSHQISVRPTSSAFQTAAVL